MAFTPRRLQGKIRYFCFYSLAILAPFLRGIYFHQGCSRASKTLEWTGCILVVYVDDSLCCASLYDKAREFSFLVEKALFWFCWLGHYIRLDTSILSIPGNKIFRFKDSLDFFLTSSRVTAHQIASAVGKIISLSQAVGNVTTCLDLLINSRVTWDS